MLVKDAMHPRGITIGVHETLPTAAVMMQELKVKRLPVVQGGKVIGLITDGEVKRNLPKLCEGLTPWEFVGRAGRLHVREVMRQPAHTVLPNTPLESVMKTMLERRIGGMPVVDEDGLLLGMLTITDVLRAEAKAPHLAWGVVEQYMTREVVSLDANAPASTAEDILRQRRLSVMPVVEGGLLVGILPKDDVENAVERALAAQGCHPEEGRNYLSHLTVSDLMKPPMGFVREGTSMLEVIKQMAELTNHGLSVIDAGGKLVGVITISDVLKIILGWPR